MIRRFFSLRVSFTGAGMVALGLVYPLQCLAWWWYQ